MQSKTCTVVETRWAPEGFRQILLIGCYFGLWENQGLFSCVVLHFYDQDFWKKLGGHDVNPLPLAVFIYNIKLNYYSDRNTSNKFEQPK
jgi:hypothetical protein